MTAPPADPPLASDDFDRTVTSGWGTADVGGAWTVRGTAVAVQRRGGSAGRIQIPAGSTLNADLSSVSSQSGRITAEFSVDKLSEGTYVSLVGAGSVRILRRATPPSGRR